MGILASAVDLSGAYAQEEKQACSNAYEQTQKLRLSGKLIAARAQAQLCIREPCAEFIRSDCAAWLSELEAGLPTVVLDVHGADGRDITAAIVTVDGQQWASSIDVAAHALDPGTHTFRVEIAGTGHAEAVVILREGEKNIRVSIVAPKPVVARPRRVRPLSAGPGELETGSVAPWVVGGIGGALVLAGSVFGILTLGAASRVEQHCDEASGKCDQEGLDAGDAGRLFGPLTTVGLALGGVTVAGAGVWLYLEGPPGTLPSSTPLQAGPSFAPDRASWYLKGAF